MEEYAHLVIKAIQEVNINALYAYKKKLILYHHQKTITTAIHDIKNIQWSKCKEKFLSMIKYVCRTFPSIVLQSSLLEFACNWDFTDFAKLILITNKRNKAEVEYDFNTCFYNACCYSYNKNILDWIDSINIDNIYEINYITTIAKILQISSHNYYRLISILKEYSIDIDWNEIFTEIYKQKYHNTNTIDALSIISKNNTFDNSIYIQCYLESITKNSIELYKWCITYFTKNNYDHNDIDIGNKNDLFISICNSSIDFACIFAGHNVIDISYNDYYTFFKICTTYGYYIDWILNKYIIPDDILIEGFKCALINSKFDNNYKYLHKYMKNKNITNIFDDFDYTIQALTLSNPSVLHWICKQTDKYIMFFDVDTKKYEIIKSNSIFNIINDLNRYINSDEKYDCDICMNDRTHFVKLECNHTYCNNCTIKLYKCPMCLKKINTNITLLISKN